MASSYSHIAFLGLVRDGDTWNRIFDVHCAGCNAGARNSIIQATQFIEISPRRILCQRRLHFVSNRRVNLQKRDDFKVRTLTSGRNAANDKAMKKLLKSDALELSGIVANSAMNRERVCVGKNSYARELSFDPLDFLKSRLETQGRADWLDLCAVVVGRWLKPPSDWPRIRRTRT